MNTLIHIGLPNAASTFFQKIVFPTAKRAHFIDPFNSEDFNTVYVPICFHEDYHYDSNVIRSYIRQHCQSENLILSRENLSCSAAIGRDVIASRLKEQFPEAKILIVLRNQAEAMISYYGQMLQNTYDSIQPFDGFFERHIRATKRGEFRHYHYDALLHYYLELFGRDNMLVILFEDLNRDRAGYVKMVSDFCKIEFENPDVDRRINVRTSHRNYVLRQIVEKFVSGERLANAWMSLPTPVRKRIKRTIKSGKPLDIELSGKQMDKLKENFGQGNAWIQKEFGFDLAGEGYPL